MKFPAMLVQTISIIQYPDQSWNNTGLGSQEIDPSECVVALVMFLNMFYYPIPWWQAIVGTAECDIQI